MPRPLRATYPCFRTGAALDNPRRPSPRENLMSPLSMSTRQGQRDGQRSLARHRPLGGLIAFAAMLAALAVSPLSAAQSFPTRPVHIIVPFAPGGAFDVLARVLGASLEPQWRQSVVVETKPG